MTGASGMHPCSASEWNKIHYAIWWSVGVVEEHGWRNGHAKRLNENYGRDETVVWWVELFILHMVLPKDVPKTVVVPQIQFITVCDATTSLPIWSVQKLEVLQNAENRKGGRCPCRDALVSSYRSKQKQGSLSPSVSFVKNQIACLVRIVWCERRLRA